jgi:hypothetical protein
VALSTARWTAPAAFVLHLLLALFLLRDGARPGHVLVAGESLARSLPWSAVLPDEPARNRFVGDQVRIFYPYLLEAAHVYAGEASWAWTPRGGGGQPWVGNMTSSMFHPLTALAAVLPVGRVPWVAGVLVLALSAQFTYLFLRRRDVSPGAALAGSLAFGFGGHQVLWLQYALSHTLLALPFCFWTVELLVQDRSRRRVALLAAGFALLVLGGHPETAWSAGAVAGLWALYRLWDAHGRFLVLVAVLLGAALSAVQWMPFLEYALQSHGLWLRRAEAARGGAGVSLGAAAIYALFLLAALALLRLSAEGGLVKRVLAVGAGVLALVMARRMGLAVSSVVPLLPDLYGSPAAGGTFTGAQDYPGLNSAYVGALPVLLLALGALVGLGGGFVRFFAVGALLLWGAAFHLPAVEGLVRHLPGFAQLEPTRLLGPVGFLVACGGALVLDALCRPQLKPGVRGAALRIALTCALVLGGAALVLRVPVDPHGGRTVVAGLIEPQPRDVFDGTAPVTIAFHLPRPAETLRVMVDGRVLRSEAAAASLPGQPVRVQYDAQRGEEGRQRLRVVAESGGQVQVIADQPLILRRERRVAARDVACVLAAALLALLLCSRRRAWGPAAAVVLVAADVLSFGDGWNAATPSAELYPPTRTGEFLRAQPGPFRIWTEGNSLPPDTQFAEGVDHVLSYDNLGYHRTYQWLLAAKVDMDAFATFSMSRETADYAHPLFDTLDVRYVLTDPGTDLSDVPGLRLAHEGEARAWENTDNAGRAWVVGHALDLRTDDPARRAELQASRPDPRVTALLEQPPPELGGRGSARVLRHLGSEVHVQVECDGPVLLVLAENRGPGWTASVDGGPERPTLACDVAWQAAEVPAGSHEVVFRLASLALRWGAGISAIAALLWLLLLLLPRHLS